VRYLAGPEDVKGYRTDLPAEDGLLVEEFLAGREVSVEAMSGDGRHRLLAITAKSTTGAPNFVETGHQLPVSLPEPEHQELWQVVDATLTAARHRFGVTHTEVMLTDAGPRLIESHGRPGGDRIGDLIRLATGVEVIEQTIALTLGLDYEPAHGRQQLAGIRYLQFDTALARPELDLSAVRALPYVHEVAIAVPAGQRPPEVHRSSDRHGFVVATGSDADELDDHLTTACAILYRQAATSAPDG
jgi:biotin carboxylase